MLYLSSTSNHNWSGLYNSTQALCYIFLLHQTTTVEALWTNAQLLCYIFLLHQTTTVCNVVMPEVGCVISFFYIKPQPIY